MVIHHPFEALHNDGSQCDGVEVIQISGVFDFFSTGMMVSALKHDGTTA